MSLTKKIVTLLVIGLASALPAFGQQDPRNAEIEAARARMQRIEQNRELQRRSVELNMLTREIHGNVDGRAPRLAVGQIKKDFLRIQVVNNELKLAASGTDALDLRFVGRSASEIKKPCEATRI